MQVKLFCFPFAGGSTYSYPFFQKYLPGFIEFIPLDIPGRGTRITEPLLYDLDAIAEDVFSRIRHQFTEPFAFFGHSMGTMIAYQLLNYLEKEGLPMPVHLFLSGRGGPNAEKENHQWHLLPSLEFRKKIFELGGSPEEVLQDERLMQLIEPILRADFQAVELFRFDKIRKYSIPVTVMIGDEEAISTEDILQWQRITDQEIKIRKFSGGHFFISEHAEEIVNTISKELQAFAI